MEKQITWSIRFIALFICSLSFLNVHAQKNTNVKGTVYDSNNEPLVGATVSVKGNSSNGTITNIDGQFSLNVQDLKSTLVVSFVGYQTQEVALHGRSEITIRLQEDAQALDEVVVIGYGTVAKKDLTGSVSSVSAKQIAAIPVSSASEALQGKMAGVSITTTEGSPDADVKIRVRGGGSLSQDNSPLYIVDGFPVSSISDIAPTDIQSVDVLKDASSTAIYGARGANGVIIITTKSGQEGKVQVNFGASYGLRKVTKMVDVLNPYEFVMWQQELDQKSFNYGTFDDLEIYKSYTDTDYQGEIFGRTGNQQQYNISVSGGNKDTKFNISYSRNDEKSIMLNSGFAKDNINAKINTKINKWLTFDFNARLSYQKVKGTGSGADDNQSSATTSVNARSVVFAPVEKLISGSSDDDENVNNARYTPIEILNATYKRVSRFQQNYNAGVNWEPVKGLKFRSEFGYGWKYNNTDQVWGVEATNNSKYGNPGMPQALLTKLITKNWRNANTVTYNNDKMFNLNHRMNVMLGHEVSSSYDHKTTMTSVGFPKNMSIKEVLANMGQGQALPTDTYIGIKDNLLSFFGRINYTINDKYLMTFTMRADGSSKFASGNQWGYFPSLALAWRISDEAFMKNAQEWLSNLKLRLSIGTAGNNRIPSGSLETTYSLAGSGDKHIYFNNTSSVVLQRGKNLSNPNLKWEETTTWNAGFDFGFLDNRITSSLDYYYRETKDLINVIDVPAGTNFKNRIVSNIGSLRNQGVEFSINAKAISTPDWKWDLGFNVAWNNNEITKLTAQDDASSIVLTGTVEGGTGTMIQAQGVNHPANSFYVYEQVYDQQGNPIEGLYVDRNGDGVINDEDRYFCHKPAADVTMGFTSKLVWKAWDFSFSLRSNLGNYVYNNVSSSNASLTECSINNKGYLSNRPLSAFDTNFQNMNVLSDYYVQNASFLRCDNITLGYSFNKLFGVLGGRIYGTVQNPFVITKYKGLDPEVANAADKTFGIDKNVYPRPLVGILGVSLNF